jgi:ABC-type glycerol-3-phosphate transport system substrate-binding protein
MKKLITFLLTVVMTLSIVTCAANPGSGGTPDDDAGLNKEIYVDKKWDILEAKHDKEVTITMWIPNSATSTMGVAIQALADKFNAEQTAEYPGKNIAVIVEYQNKSSTLNEKLQAAILAGNNPVVSAIGVSSVPLYEARALDLRRVFTYEQLQQQSQGMMQYSLYNGKYMLNPKALPCPM